MKTCRICGERKPLSAYYKQPRNEDGYFHECKTCVKQRVTESRRKRGVKPRRAVELRDERLYCPDCGTWKHASDFYSDVNKKYGAASICKVCDNARRAKR